MSRFKEAVSAERKLFETWYMRSHTGATVARTGKGYIDNTTRVAWRAWQARAGVSEDDLSDKPRNHVEQFTRMAQARKDTDAFQALIDKGQPL